MQSRSSVVLPVQADCEDGPRRVHLRTGVCRGTGNLRAKRLPAEETGKLLRTHCVPSLNGTVIWTVVTQSDKALQGNARHQPKPGGGKKRELAG